MLTPDSPVVEFAQIFFYGGLIALAGCLRGFQCGDSSSAVGDAATKAVVMSIVMVVAACGAFAVAFNFLHL